MKKVLFTFIFLGVSLFANDVIIKKSNKSVDATIETIQKIVTKKGLHVFAIIDHAKGAKKVGMKLLPSKVIIFGNPKMGTLLMQDDASAALDLPLKIAVYQVQSGDVFMAYRDGTSLQQAHSRITKQKVIQKITTALDKITTKAVM